MVPGGIDGQREGAQKCIKSENKERLNHQHLTIDFRQSAPTLSAVFSSTHTRVMSPPRRHVVPGPSHCSRQTLCLPPPPLCVHLSVAVLPVLTNDDSSDGRWSLMESLGPTVMEGWCSKYPLLVL